MKRSLLLFFVLVLPLTTRAQRPDSFPSNPNAFLPILESYMSADKNKMLIEAFEGFNELFSAGAFSEEEATRIIAVCNQMLEKRMSNNPYFRVYLNVLPWVKKADTDGQRFDQWHSILEYYLDSGARNRIIKEFIEASTSFFKTGALRYSEGGTTWLANSNDYQIALQDSMPIIKWPDTDLKAYRRTDTMTITGTSGTYEIMKNSWSGEGGKVYWDSTGLGDGIYVQLSAYEIDLDKSFYELDSIHFYLPAFFGSRGIRGTFSDRITNEASSQASSYPRFISQEGALQIDDLGEGIRFSGGFALEGGTIYGTRTPEGPARIQLFKQNGQEVFSAAGDRLVVQQGAELSGQDLRGVFYYQNDSIVHPSVSIRYDIQAGELELRRGESGNGRNPFYSSAHRVNINAEYLKANINSDSVEIGKKSARIMKKPAVTFESLTYFNRREYEQLQGLSAVNPLIVLLQASHRRGNTQILQASDIAAVYGGQMSEASLTNLLFKLSGQGFINYEAESGRVELKEKMHHYLKAYSGQLDFDRIQLQSDTLATNAYLDISNNNIQVRGVKQLEFSPSKRVALLPDSNRLTLKPDMNMDFDGTLFAGFSEIKGKDFHFDYQTFQIGMDSIKRLRFFPPENNQAFALTSDIEDANGVLLIDAPSNKSGLDTSQALAVFPTFTTKSPAYVFYDDSTRVADTVYKRRTFFLELDPFTLNSLTNYDKEDLSFSSRLVSADIFPDFKETAVVRPDYSIGFEHETPEEGYSMYQNKGRYKGKIDLSNRGLLGVGQLDYLGASIQSEDFVFRPLGTTGTAKAFDLPESREGVETPKVHADQVSLDWLPYKDSLYIRSQKFDLFQDPGYALEGLLTLTPGGVKGRGTITWPKASLSSEFFSFGANTVQSDSMDIFIKSLKAGGALALETKNFRGIVDFDQMTGKFRGNDTAIVQLTHNQYISTLNGFEWDMNKELLTLKRDDNRPGLFTSIVPGQDSLRFRGKNASIDLQNNDLIIQEVPYIPAADALVYPDSNQVVIQPGGVIKTLKNATIVADSVRKTHRIVRAEVDITGRTTYQAKGFYEYNIAGREQEISFSDIVGERVGRGRISQRPTATRASGTVAPEDSFRIDRKTSFYGDINLASESVNLQFNGFARLDAERLPRKHWFGINCEADKNNLIIPYDHPRDEEGYQVFTGFYLGRDMPVIYPSVMTPPNTLQDRRILDVTGIFKYDAAKDHFLFGDSSKVTKDEYLGDFLRFDNKSGQVFGEGRLNLLDELKYTSLDAVGTIESAFVEVPDSLRGQTPPPPVQIEVMSGLKFILPDRLFRFILAEVERNALSLDAIPYLAKQEKYKKQLTMLFPNAGKDLQDAFASMALGRVDLPKKVNDYTILLADLKMKWDMDYQSFVSTDNKIGVISINGEPVNRRMEGYVEYKMPSIGGDRFYYYLKFPSQIFYYFGFKQGILEVYSNDSQFMDTASSMKKNEMVVKMPDGNTYEILIETASRANMFVRRIKAVN